VTAVREGNPDIAGQAMERHLQDVSGKLRARIGNGKTIDEFETEQDPSPHI